MSYILPASRRLFLRQAGALSLLTGAGAPMALNLMAAGSAAAQTATDYKALVCVFLFGGNDAYNMVLPTDSASWQAYNATRNQAPDSIALQVPGTAGNASAALASPASLGGVLPITPINSQSRTFALHPLMGSLQTMFNTERRLAVLPNIGPLIRPTTKTQYSQISHAKPANLYSHNDQQNTWMSGAPEGAVQGWGGRLTDAMIASNTEAVFTSVSAAGNAVWLSGRSVRQYQVSGSGAIRTGQDSDGRVYGSTEVGLALNRIVGNTRGTHVFETDVAAIAQRSINAELSLRTALKPASDAAFGTAQASSSYNSNIDPKMQYDNPLTGARSTNFLAQQMQIVARMVDAGMSGATGVKRQVFFVSMGGFDTHDEQNRNQADLMAKLTQGLRYLDTALGAINARNNVTTFTASDFGRTFTSNGDGTDHGWGAHHFVMGGAVKGGDFYGRFPTLGVKNSNNNNFDSSANLLDNGALLPETAVDQLGATLGSWFGLSSAQLVDVFPALANFDMSKRNLGFMA
jgi:uncharacterized protein (DUF1501 family)